MRRYAYGKRADPKLRTLLLFGDFLRNILAFSRRDEATCRKTLSFMGLRLPAEQPLFLKTTFDDHKNISTSQKKKMSSKDNDHEVKESHETSEPSPSPMEKNGPENEKHVEEFSLFANMNQWPNSSHSSGVAAVVDFDCLAPTCMAETWQWGSILSVEQE